MFLLPHTWSACGIPLLNASHGIRKGSYSIRMKGANVIIFILNHKPLGCKYKVRTEHTPIWGGTATTQTCLILEKLLFILLV